MLILANGFTLPVTATYMTGPPGTPPGEPTTLFDVRIAWGVAAFFALSALAHLIVCIAGVFSRAYVTLSLVAKSLLPGRSSAARWPVDEASHRCHPVRSARAQHHRCRFIAGASAARG